VIDFFELDMAQHMLATTAAMYLVTGNSVLDEGIETPRIPGSLRAAEHAAIGPLPWGQPPRAARFLCVRRLPRRDGFAEHGFRKRAKVRTDARRACNPPNAATTRRTNRELCWRCGLVLAELGSRNAPNDGGMATDPSTVDPTHSRRDSRQQTRFPHC
jgi:hypothetical protein